MSIFSIMEVTKRLPPTPSTLRQLYVHSGNRCAFSECDRVLVNGKGQWVGEVCHIEAAMPGGERFNHASSNEERRRPANLMLMCHEHHVETNDVISFSVHDLRDLKAAHEKKFAGQSVPHERDIEEVVNDIVESEITDLTDRAEVRLPQTLAGYNAVLGHRLSPEELLGSLELVVPVLLALRRVPVDARAVFAVAMDRSHPGSANVPVHELESVTGLEPDEVHRHVTILERYRIASFDEEELGFDRPPIPVLEAFDVDGWGFWSEFTTFCDETGRSARTTINELKFDVLDDVPT